LGFCLGLAYLQAPEYQRKLLGFGAFRLSKLRQDTPFGMEMPRHGENSISDHRTFWPKLFELTDFFLLVVILTLVH
jgi:hypothetical protein